MSAEVKTEIKENGYENRLIEKIKTDPYFKNILHELPSILDATTFVGCASLQVTLLACIEFIYYLIIYLFRIF